MRTMNVRGVDLPISRIDGRAVDLSGLSGGERTHLRTGAGNVQLTDPLVTALALGQMSKRPSFVNFLAPIQFVDKIRVEYPTWAGNEWMENQNTLRGESAPYNTAKMEPSKETINLERHSFAFMADQRVFQNSDASLRVREKYAMSAAKVVEISIQHQVAAIMEASGNYAGSHFVTLGGGAEWDDAAVDPRDSVDTAIAAISGAIGVSAEDIYGFLPEASKRALYRNPVFRSWNTGQQAKVANNPNFNVVSDFFGIGPVLSENPWSKNAGTTGPIFADSFYLFVPGVGGEYDTEFGEQRWLGHLRTATGIASEPFYDSKTTTWFFPWDVEVATPVFHTGAAYRIGNTQS